MTLPNKTFVASRFSRRRLLTATAAGCAVLAGCKDGFKSPDAAKPAALAVSVAAVAQDATGFSAGSAMSARVVYVFFDAQC
ncbi:MAG: hypothetical protein H7224_09990, partial [Polaromonas sp.]|nr:hypothetical protein [Polaromonas sp.]